MSRPEIHLPPRPRGLRFDALAVEEPHFDVRADAGRAIISIFDSIGGETNTARIVGALRQIGNRPVLLEINSLGGDVFEGIGIYNALIRHPQPITVQILGIAASAASVIAMAGERIEIAESAEIMIHNAHGIVAGDRNDMRSFADVLEQIDTSMTAIYAGRTGLSEDQLRRMMDEETFFPSQEAIDLGFADATLDREGADKPKALGRSFPASKRDFESQLRTIGLSKSQATHAAAAAWPTINREDIDIDRIAARVDFHRTEISKWK